MWAGLFLLIILGACRSAPVAAPSSTAALDHLTRGDWPVAGRLAGVHHRALAAEAPIDPVAVATLKLDFQARGDETAATRGHAALLEFLDAKPDQVVAQLAALCAEQPDDPDAVNNLIVAHMTEGAQQAAPLAWLRALERTEAAFARGFDSLALRTNYALILSHLWLNDHARRAWHKLLERETDPTWRKRADDALAELDQRVAMADPASREHFLQAALAEQRWDDVAAWVARFPGIAWRWMERRLVDDFAGDGDPAILVEVHRVLAADPNRFAEWAAFVDELTDTPQPQAAEALAHARAAEKEEAYPCMLSAADTILAQVPAASFYRVAAHYQKARAYFFLGRLDDALEQAEWVDVLARERGFPTLTGLNLGIQAMVVGYRGDLTRNFTLHEEGRVLFEQLGDRRNLCHFMDSVGDGLQGLGQPQRALALHVGLLPQSVFYTSHKRRSLLYRNVVRGLLAQGFHYGAVRFGEAAEALLEREMDQFEWLRGRADQARCLWQLGRTDAALGLLDETLVRLDSRAEDAWLPQNEAELRALRGRYRLATDNLSGARDDLTRAVALSRSAEHRGPKLIRAGVALAETYRRLGDDAAALALLEAEVVAIEAARPQALLDHKVAFFDHLRGVYDGLVDLYLRAGRPGAALQAAEAARARFLGDQVQAGKSVDAQSVQAALQPGESLLFYHPLADRLAIWVFQRDGVYQREIAVGRNALQTYCTADGADLGAGEHGAALYQAVLGSVADLTVGDGPLIFALDGPLWRVAPAALWDPERGHHLVADRVTAVVPSLTMFLVARSRRPQAASGRQVCVVGNPRHDRRLLPLGSMPHAETEAVAVAERFGVTPLLGDAATIHAFRAEAAKAPIIHFAGHAVHHPDNPLRSFLLLAPDSLTANAGALGARDLFHWRLPHTRLVVLSACAGGAASSSPSEGGGNLARPFLAAGVPSVATTLAPLPDSPATVAFIEHFYEALAKERDAGKALRTAQLAAIRDGVPREIWAVWQIFGVP